MDYAFLRQQGLRHLERMAGELWTDWNVHDPGITILEQLCYALTDLSYRIAHEIPDLLASGGGDAYEGLYPAPEILTCHPVTLTDLRKLILDVDGVRNAWIEEVEEQEIPFHYHPGKAELSLEAEPPSSEPVRLKGLYRVLIEPSDLAGIDGTVVRTNVARRLHAHRNLCEDFTEIRILEPQRIQVRAAVEIGPVEDAEPVLLEILERIADEISPPIPFASLDQRLQAGAAVDEIFDGPRLEKGFIETEILPQETRRASINTSDLIHAITEVPGVLAVRRISVSAGGESKAWSLRTLDPSKTPQLDLPGSVILLEKGGITVGIDSGRVLAAYAERRKASSSVRPGSADAFFTPPAGRDRNVGHYESVQGHFPALYGIGDMGLPSSATPRRKAQARQLKAYLMFFDQLLASYFTQLAHVKDLFSFHGDSLRTSFVQMLEDSGLGLDEVRVHHGAAHQGRLDEITESFPERKNRFLSHLLARFAEQFTDYSLVLFESLPTGSAEKLARDKQAFLRRYPRISSARGTAFDDLRLGSVSGLEERVRLKLGLDEELGEELVLVEHILLRPMAGDEQQQVPLLAASRYKDPYSLQLSFVFPQSAARFKKPGFKRFIEQTIREETPAHLTPYVHWLETSDWEELRAAHEQWLVKRRDYWCEKLGVPLEEEPGS